MLKFFAIISFCAILSVKCSFDCESTELKVGGFIPSTEKGSTGFGEFPWVVALYKKDSPKPHCTGSIIDESTIVTTAFCVKKISSPSELIVRAGLWDLNRTMVEEFNMQQRSASVIISHQKYSSPDPIENDIALIRVNQPFKFTRHINKICLAKDSIKVDTSGCYATGWGAAAPDENGFSQFLKKVPMDQVDHHVCEEKLRVALKENSFKLSDGFLCAGGFENDLCTNDAGSSLICPISGSPNKFVLTGMSSFGVKCFTETPGVYTRISKYREWINYPTEIKISS